MGHIAFNQGHSSFFSQTLWEGKNKFQKAENNPKIFLQ